MMSRPQKTKATGGQPMAFKTTHDTKSKRTEVEPELQTSRRSGQASLPTWTRPPGADAADDLAAALRKWGSR